MKFLYIFNLCSFSGHISPSFMLTTEPKMFSIFWARSPISFKHMMPFWCPSSKPHLIAFHSNIGVHIIVMLELCMFTLYVLALSFGPVWVVALSQNTSLKVCGPFLSTSSPIDTFVCWISLEIVSSSLAIVMDHTKGHFSSFWNSCFCVVEGKFWWASLVLQAFKSGLNPRP